MDQYLDNFTPTGPAVLPADVQSERATLWGAVICMSMLTFTLIASEFMPVSLLTPIAQDLGITEGQAGQAIAISGLFAIVASLFGNALLSKMDRRNVVLLYTGLLILSGLAVAGAPNFTLFMLGRAMLGLAIGGFWSLSTSIMARLATPSELPKALAMLQGGTALAVLIAAPLGSFVGGLIGWRGSFFLIVPIGLVVLLWQFIVIPSLPPQRHVPASAIFGLFRRPLVALGMTATAFAFLGQFTLTTYLRPFLETVTGLGINALSLALLGLGLGGLAGTVIIGFVLRARITAVLVGIPSALSLLAVCLVVFGHLGLVVGVLLVVWGLFTTPIPVAWGTWMTRVIPHDLEAGGGLQVALIQFAITAGAVLGGVLFDSSGVSSTFLIAAALLALAAVLALLTVRRS
jgi:predicted MFS family arabinose efflux permease